MSGSSKPRLGFLGLGWIGLHRMRAIADSGVAEISALADPDRSSRERARGFAPNAEVASSFEELLSVPLDGIVIATPSALHAVQSLRALERDLAVFCQKPLGRSAAEARRVVALARARDKLLGVDFSYRLTEAMQHVYALVRSGELGSIYAAQLIFHNAYGPDKPWFYDAELSGGGALIDLGSHLIDLTLWMLDYPQLTSVTSQLYAHGAPLDAGDPHAVEDYAAAQLTFDPVLTVSIACSWRLHAGCDCVIEASFYGTEGAASLRNVGGSFYDFTAEAFFGTQRRVLANPPDAWGGRAAVAWADKLARGSGYDGSVDGALAVAHVLDCIYGASMPATFQERPCAS